MVDSGGGLVSFRVEGVRGTSSVEFDGWFVLVIVVLNAMMRTMRNDDQTLLVVGHDLLSTRLIIATMFWG
jgi:hypothetical protein